MMKITSREWKHHCKDYKGTFSQDPLKGQKYIMYNGGLEPVEIDDEDGVEMCRWTFTECGLSYSCIAYTEEEAWEIIVSSGHSLSLVKDLKNAGSIRVKSKQ